MSAIQQTEVAIPVRGLAPLLQVYDVPTSLHFYCEVLGFIVVNQAGPPEYPHWLLLRLDETELMMEPLYPLDKKPPVPDEARRAVHADTTLYFGCPDVDKAYVRMRDKGFAVNPPRVAYYGMKQLYCQDPDGYGICFQWPAKEEEKAG